MASSPRLFWNSIKFAIGTSVFSFLVGSSGYGILMSAVQVRLLSAKAA